MLDHADDRHLVEVAGRIQAGRGNPLRMSTGKPAVNCARNRSAPSERLMPVTWQPRVSEAYREAAPAATDVEHFVARLEIQFVADHLQLVSLGASSRVWARLKKQQVYWFQGAEKALVHPMIES